MKRYPVSLVLVFLVLLGVTSGCAKQGYPTGGPKDEEPPRVLNAKPANESRHFDRDRFFIQFDEFVVLKNVSENVLVSPPMKEKPEITTKGRGVLVKLNDTLQSNTTYLFQFKDAIADFTEGNVLPSFEYVFSTGDGMDTMMLAGQAIDARSGNPRKEMVTVMAYREELFTTDTAATTEQPSFVTRCDKNGNFAFHYIPEGRYRLVAFEDRNRDLRVDVAEAVAWDTVAVASTDSIDSTQTLLYRLSAPVIRKQRITKSEFVGRGHIRVATQCPMIHPAVEGEPVEWRLNARRDTMSIWCLNAQCDSARIIISDEDLQDTLSMKFTEKKMGRRVSKGKKVQDKTPLVKALCAGKAAFYDDLRLAFTVPIVTMADSARAEIMALKDSTVRYYPIILDSGGITGRIDAILRSDEQYNVTLRDSLFTDLRGNSNDSLVFSLTPKDYGTLSVTVNNLTASPLVIEVLDKRDTVMQSQSLMASGRLRFIHLPAGEYRLRAIVDADSNGRWTAGDYRLQRQPEICIVFDKTLNLREKWEIEELWRVEKEKRKNESTEKKVIPQRKDLDPNVIKPRIGR